MVKEVIILGLIISIPMVFLTKLVIFFTKKYSLKQSWLWMLFAWIFFICLLVWFGSKVSM